MEREPERPHRQSREGLMSGEGSDEGRARSQSSLRLPASTSEHGRAAKKTDIEFFFFLPSPSPLVGKKSLHAKNERLLAGQRNSKAAQSTLNYQQFALAASHLAFKQVSPHSA